MTRNTVCLALASLLLSACDGERQGPLAPLPLFQASASLTPISGTIRVVTTGGFDQFDPAISGDIVVFTEVVSHATDVSYVDLSSGAAANLTTSGTADDALTDVSGGTIVYTTTDLVTGDADVQAFVIGGSASAVAALAGSQQRNPAVSGPLVAWEDTRDGNLEIYAKDLSSGTEKRLSTTAAASEHDAAVSGTRVAYARVDAVSCQIMLTDFVTLVTTQVTTVAGCHRLPDISGNTVVYEGDRDGNPDIFVFALASGRETRLALPGIQRNPNVSGDWVAYEEVTSSGARDIMLYHIPSTRHFAAVATSHNEFLNDIDGFRVVYTTDVSGDLDIALFEFTPPLTDPKVALGDLTVLVRSFNLSQGTETALLAKLQAALASLGRGSSAATCGQLDPFIQQVQAQSGQALTAAQAALLIAEATRIKGLLGCP